MGEAASDNAEASMLASSAMVEDVNDNAQMGVVGGFFSRVLGGGSQRRNDQHQSAISPATVASTAVPSAERANRSSSSLLPQARQIVDEVAPELTEELHERAPGLHPSRFHNHKTRSATGARGHHQQREPQSREEDEAQEEEEQQRFLAKLKKEEEERQQMRRATNQNQTKHARVSQPSPSISTPQKVQGIVVACAGA